MLFADDTTLIASNSDFTVLIDSINENLDHVHNWLLCNKLSLNVLKTKYLIFRNTQNTSEIYDKTSLLIDANNIEQCSSITYLGVKLDQHLTWDPHIDYISSKISRNVGILRHIKHFVPLPILFTMYNAFILPHIMYCNSVWATAYPSKLLKLYRLQKRALRICANADFLAPSKPLFYKFNALNVYDINKVKICLIMHRYFPDTLPEYLKEMFSLNLNVHNHNTRSCQLFHTWKVTSHSFYKSIRFTGPIMWNSLPSSLRNIQFLNSCKHKYKLYLLSQYT